MQGGPITVPWTEGGSRVVVVLVAVSLAVAGPAVGVPSSPDQPGVEAAAALQADQPTPTNETLRHEHPDRVSGRQDLASVRGWLAGRMATQLERCVVEVGFGTTNVCEIDDQYPDWLGQYVDVAEQTDGTDDDQRAAAFDETKREHEAYSQAVSDFTRTYDAYQDAKAAGDDERARQLARDLRRQADQVAENGSDLLTTYRHLEGEPTVALGAAKTGVNGTVENVSRTTESVETAEFVRTVLTAELHPRAVSFLGPGTVSGRLTTSNGSGIANRAIDLLVGDRRRSARTDDAGRFSVEYRPITLPLSTDQLEIRYQPRAASFYLGNWTTVPISIGQVEPDVTVDVDPRTAAFADAIRVTGTVSADGSDAPDVPVRVVLDGRPIGTVRTDDAGRFSRPVTIDAADGPGATEIQATVALEDRALAPGVGVAALTIEATPTAVTVEPSVGGPRQVTVTGQLTTRAGDPVPNQPVTLRLNGTAVESVRTAGDGTYRARVSVPAALGANDGPTTVGVGARFDGAQTNLEGSSARAVVTLPAPRADRPAGAVETAARRVIDLVRDSPAWSAALGFLGLALGAALVYAGYRFSRRGSSRPRAPAPPADETVDAGPGGAPGSDARPVDPMAPARHRLDADADADGAVMLAYAAVRERLGRSGGPDARQADTHWEFLAACRQDGLADDALDGLTELTQTYEAAAYAPNPVGRAEAATAVSIAERLV